MKRRIVTYEISAPEIRREHLLAMLSDLHCGPWEDLLQPLRDAEGILVAGDLVDRHSGAFEPAVDFLRTICRDKPVWFAPGNHEMKHPERKKVIRLIRKTGVHWLYNSLEYYEEFTIGGLVRESRKQVRTEVLDRMERESGYRLLLCHHPEVYRDRVAGRAIHLTLSGHAHGGQVRIFGQGLYAPGQGLFPKLTHGVYDDGRLIVSSGLTNGARVPRFNDPCEMVLLHLKPGEERKVITIE